MQNKLQELTDKLYNEGLSKGQQEAENLLTKTTEDIKRMLADAQEEARQIIEDANKKAEETKENAAVEIRLAGRQAIEQVKSSIEEDLMVRVISDPVKSAFNDTEFVKEIIKAAIGQFSLGADNNVDLSLLLPEDKKKQLEDFTTDKVQKFLKDGVDVQYSKSLKGGFRIKQNDKGYYISFTDNDFENLFKEYLRSSVRDLLFTK